MGKIKQWIISHKVWSIVIASVLVVGITLSIALPLALRHKHTYSEEWSHNASCHWHVCTGEDCDEISDEAAHNFVAGTEGTQKLKVCSDCGYSVVTSISEERLTNAMALKDENDNYYTNFDILYMNSMNSIDNIVRQYKVAENAAYKYTTASDVNNLETIWTNENGKDVIYTKHNTESKWRREEEETTDTNFANRILPQNLILGQNNITYDSIKDNYTESDFAYHTTYPTSSHQMSVALYFEGGKLVKISFELTTSSSSSLTGTRTITYGNAEIDIPSESEQIIKVNYDESTNEFTTLNNVSLVAGETKWFKIELDDSIHSESKGTNGYEIAGSFTTSDNDAITITAEKENHQTITGTVNDGMFYFENLMQGVYFIKITATANCTGSFGVSFG